MGIWDKITGQFIDVIEWTDDTRDTISWRFPDDDKAIKNGAQLIVRESQVAQFVYLGAFGDTFGPGKHALTTDNIPVLTTPVQTQPPAHDYSALTTPSVWRNVRSSCSRASSYRRPMNRLME